MFLKSIFKRIGYNLIGNLKKYPFHPSSLHYDSEKDIYICPMGQRMRNIGTVKKKTASGFDQELTRCQAGNCQGCPLRGACYKSKGNRIIQINHRLNQYKAQARDKFNSEEGIANLARNKGREKD